MRQKLWDVWDVCLSEHFAELWAAMCRVKQSVCYVIASPKWEVSVCPCVPWQPCLIFMLCLLPQIKLSRDGIWKPHWLAPCKYMWSQTGVHVGMNRECFAELQSKRWACFGNGRLRNGSWECSLNSFCLLSAFHLCMWMLRLLSFFTAGVVRFDFSAFHMNWSHSASSWRSEHYSRN